MEQIVNSGLNEEKLEALSDLTLYYQDNDISKALSYAWKQKQIALKTNQTYWLGDAYENLGYIYFYDQYIDSTEYYFQEAYKIWNKTDNKIKIGASLSNLSLIFRLKNQSDSAIFYLQKARTIFEEEKKDFLVSQVLANIASIYNDIGNHIKHDQYALMALALQEKLDDNRALGITLINLCESMEAQSRYDEAVEYGERALKAFREIDQSLFICAALIRTGSVLFQLNENKRAMDYLTEAIAIAEYLGNNQMKNEALLLKVNYYLQQKEYKNAKLNAINLLALTDTANKRDLMRIYDCLLTASIFTNEKDDAIKYFKKYVDTKNELQQQLFIDNISELEIKYETEKKELKITTLEEEKRLIRWLSIAGGALLLLALTTFILLWRFTAQKKHLAETQIKQFEQEKQLVATQSVLDGETHERSRLARDLHDGLGSMLTGVRLNLQEMKDGVKLEYVDLERFDRALVLLDESVREMRRVSHHLMPESLNRFGLKSAVNDFCHSLNSHITFDYFGDETRLDPKIEVMLYRTIHELINNALKHSGSQHIMVQIMQEPDRIAFTVQDDGCGFNPKEPTDGTGLQNIRTRMAAYNGTLLVDSKAGEGTEVSGELKVRNS
ncbi:MAG: sensor histidine kinase [Lentimicrobiaceae bacterium]|nr:sensor histidine kinase [Lentimicrobiaceae bacterium]